MTSASAIPRLTAPVKDPDVLHETLEAVEAISVPQFNVVLLDDNDHTYEYVIEMLSHLFGHTMETAYQMAVTVDRTGRVVVSTTYRERAELKRDQIHGYGPDWRIPHSKGSMSAVVEPVDSAP
jgi:ATP-dependent Clp protease adaptor protein ClpS